MEPLLPEGARIFTSAAEMLEAVRPDVVHIVTPPASHAELAMLCLARGAHVYVEKPFTLTAAEAREVLAGAERAGRSVCVGHQLLFERRPARCAACAPSIGKVVHVESYFSFKTVRKSRDGRTPMSPVEQLLDILPHPVYTLLHALRAPRPERGGRRSRRSKCGPKAKFTRSCARARPPACSSVTLRGRPIESYLRVVGTNGCLRADFVRGALTQLAGAGTSAISILSNPYREAKQIVFGSTSGFASRVLHKKKGYPGLIGADRRVLQQHSAGRSAATLAGIDPGYRAAVRARGARASRRGK